MRNVFLCDVTKGLFRILPRRESGRIGVYPLDFISWDAFGKYSFF